jgi:hypothetical protein
MSDIAPKPFTSRDIFNNRPASIEQLWQLSDIRNYFGADSGSLGKSKWFSYVHYPDYGQYILTRGTPNGTERLAFKPLLLDIEADLDESSPARQCPGLGG